MLPSVDSIMDVLSSDEDIVSSLLWSMHCLGMNLVLLYAAARDISCWLCVTCTVECIVALY